MCMFFSNMHCFRFQFLFSFIFLLRSSSSIQSVDAGQEVAAGEAVADIESVKTTSSIYSPVAGVLKEFNSSIEENPGNVNSEGEKIWFWRFEQVKDNEDLLSEDQYKDYLQTLNDEHQEGG